MEEKKPLVSIIIRTKDRPKLLKNALKSIATQTYRPIEVVLVNDGGCDLDVEEIKTILGDVSLNYKRLKKNTGRAHAGNVGIENAKGEYIGFLDDDDEFYPEHVLTLVSLLTTTPYKVGYTDSLMVYIEGDEHNKKEEKLVFSHDFDYDGLVFENYIPFMCLLFSMDVLSESKGFDEEFDLYEDWDLLIRIGKKYPFRHIKKVTARYNQWSIEHQISQRNTNPEFLKGSYLKVVTKHIDKIGPEKIHYYVSSCTNLRYLLQKVRDEFEEYRRQVSKNDIYLSNLEAEVKRKDSLIDNLEAEARERDRSISIIEDDLLQKEAYIRLIHAGYGWRLLNKYFRVRDRLLPEGTKRRLFVRLIIKAIVNPKEVFGNLNRTNLKKFLYYLKLSDPLTVEKKVEQKLSYTISDKGVPKGPIDQMPFPKGKSVFSSKWDIKSKDYVPLSQPNIRDMDIRLIAFYLPQFHPIPENDAWWGKGFTEWTNVTKAMPQFNGHYQPRLPGELGFYDLRIPEIQERQIELAKQYGIYGFCVHFYWFNGRTLLEMPLKRFAEKFDFPFCINWANENWTRTWDGKDKEVLIAQNHTPEDDINFIKYISSYLKNKNYIRIKSRPLLVIYRPMLFPNPKATAERWREWCCNNGIGEIYLAVVHSFEHVDPESIGFDAAIEFPPNTFPLKDISKRFSLINQNFKGVILNYEDAIELSENYIKPQYKKFRGICPGWDNEARRPERGTVLANSTPDNFKKWLKILCHFTRYNFELEDRLIFVNAWNEWAEGAYLEPDRRYGYAYLQAVADALIEYNSDKKKKEKIVFVGHDAHYHGAQLILLHIIKRLSRKFNFDVHLGLKSGGCLEKEYARYAKVYNLERDYNNNRKVKDLLDRFTMLGVKNAICSTVVTGDIVEHLCKKGFYVITLVHELPQIIKEMRMEKNAERVAMYSHKIVFPSTFVKERFKNITLVDDDKVVIRPQGLYRINKYKTRKAEARKLLREKFSVPVTAKIVIGVGFADYRKGIDLFIKVADLTLRKRKDIYFLWIGDIHIGLKAKIQEECRKISNIRLVGKQEDISLFFAGADLYLLTSREDPFPTVVLEAMEVGLPVIGFDGTGGATEIIRETSGVLVPNLDVDSMANALIQLADNVQRIQKISEKSYRLIEERFNYNDYVYALLEFLGYGYKKVSVIIPNYNYSRYLKGRIEGVLKQTYPLYEIIFLDDASTDNSVEIIKHYIDEELNIRLVKNDKNSGSVFRQWIKGIEMARGDYIWIAEADDLCEETFLEELMRCFERDRDVVLAYSQSRQMDEMGRILADDYLEYTNDIDRGKWRSDYIRDGLSEISDTLAIKNTIPNASAVVFKKPLDFNQIKDKMVRFKIVGDWFYYIWLLQHGKIAYISRPLNLHRRHEMGVTKSEDKKLHYNEIIGMQDFVMERFDISEETKAKLFSYRRYLIEYFNLGHYVKT